MLKKSITSLILIGLTMFAFWYLFIALKPQAIPQSEILTAYNYKARENINLKLQSLGGGNFGFTYISFDGQKVTGQLAYPESDFKSNPGLAKKTVIRSYPVLLGVPAMGRSYIRWFVDSFKDRPTVTSVNKVTALAKQQGMVVISIDPRYHGKRKDRNKTLRSIMLRMGLLGDKTDYESMIKDTVLDYRVLLDWINSQEAFDGQQLTVAGYSMGGQIALLLGSIDHRIAKVVSIVPPFIDDKIAMVAPINVVDKLTGKAVLLLTANDDENSSIEQNNLLYQKISSENKTHITFEGGHILPSSYVSKIAEWL